MVSLNLICIIWVDRKFLRLIVHSHSFTPYSIPIYINISSDLANGVKLLILSATRGSSPCFVSGLTIFCVATLAIYTSFTYNVAIAMTNTGKHEIFVVYFIVVKGKWPRNGEN